MQSFRRCLIDLDIRAARQLWATLAPGQSQPKDDGETLITLHYARTQARSVPFNLRAYSHSWLTERELPSGLPDELKPRADRLYPRVVEAVGVSVKSFSAAGVPLAQAIERAMSGAVAECYADGERRPEIVRARMQEARNKVTA